MVERTQQAYTRLDGKAFFYKAENRQNITTNPLEQQVALQNYQFSSYFILLPTNKIKEAYQQKLLEQYSHCELFLVKII